MNGTDFIFETLPELYEGIETRPSTPSDFCACCQRHVKDTAVPDKSWEGKIYSKTEVHCVPCQVLYHPNQKHFGVEGYRSRQVRYADKETALKANQALTRMGDVKVKDRVTSLSKEGFTLFPTEEDAIAALGEAYEVVVNAGSAVIGKLGMLVGAGMAISANKAIFYAPGKHFDKLTGVGELFIKKQIGGYAMITDVINEFDGSEPFLFIGDFGKKKAELVSNLTLSKGKRSFISCSANGAMRINRNAYLALRQYVLAHFSSAPKSTTADFFKTLRSLASGYTHVSVAQDKLKDLPRIGELLKTLPTCPHERIELTIAVDKGL